LLHQGVGTLAAGVQIEHFLKVVICNSELAELHAGPGSIEEVLRIVWEEIDCPTELNVGTFVVKPVKAQSAQRIVVQTQSRFNQL